MRVFVFFDLPILTSSERREYRRFRKFLILNGFVMEQESVYSKMVLNGNAANTIKAHVRQCAPENGLVELLVVTEKQFASIEYVTGEKTGEYVTTPNRLVIL